MIAPATAPDDDAFVLEVQRFLENDRYTDDTIYLSSLDGPVGTMPEDGDGIEIVHGSDVASHDGQLRADDTLRVHGEAMVLGDVAWAEREDDGDGNRYLNIVMSDGRYRRIAAGDLGR